MTTKRNNPVSDVNREVLHLAGYPGELLINALQELVLPLIILALMTGVLNLRHTTTGYTGPFIE